MLAMDANDNAYCLDTRVTRTLFASKLRPYGSAPAGRTI